MESVFQFAAGSVTGRDHVFAGRNNQDAFCVWSGPEAVVVVVADGCGSGRFSEVGARLGSRLVVQAILRRMKPGGQAPDAMLEEVRRDVLRALGSLAGALGDSRSHTVSDLLLFTVVGAVVGPALSFVFALGDGVIAVNGDVRVLDSPGNAPAYLAYGLDGSDGGADAPRFTIHCRLPTDALETLLVASDGAADLIAARDLCLPGREETLGPLARLWDEDRHFVNPASLGRRLHVANHAVQHIDWQARSVEREPGLLSDDTTVAIIRRRRNPQRGAVVAGTQA
jgi:hypothetical protein